MFANIYLVCIYTHSWFVTFCWQVMCLSREIIIERLSNPLPMVFWPPTHGISNPLPIVFWTPYPWYIKPLHMVYHSPSTVFWPPTHGVSTPLSIVYWPTYSWYIGPLPMVYWTLYSWYIKPPSDDISNLLPMVFWPPFPCNIKPSTHGILNPLFMVYRTFYPWYIVLPIHGIRNPLPMVFSPPPMVYRTHYSIYRCCWNVAIQVTCLRLEQKVHINSLNILETVVVVIVCYLDLQLPVQSVPITTNVASSNSCQLRCTWYNIMW